MVEPLSASSRAKRVRPFLSQCAPYVRATAVALILLAWDLPLSGQSASTQNSPPEAARRPEETTADTLLQSNKAREALAELDRAALAYRRTGDRVGRARVAYKRSTAWHRLGDLEKASQEAEAALAHGVEDHALLLQILTHAARVATDRQEFGRADVALRKALAVADRQADARSQATVLRALGVLEDRRGKPDDALAYMRRAVAAADRSGDVPTRVRVRAALSTTLLGLSRYDEALAIAQESHDVAERDGTADVRALALFDLAQTNAHVWNLDRAAELWTATIDAHRRSGVHTMVALAMKQSVETWFALGDFDRAATDGERAVELLRETGQPYYVAETAARVALSHVRGGRSDDARRWVDRARAELATAPVSRHHFVHNDVGLVAAELGEIEVARQDFARVLEVSRRLGSVEYEWRAHWGFGRAALRDRPADAVPHLERAIASVERLRQTIPAASLRAAFMLNRVGPYETLVEAHMALSSSPADDRARLAFEAAERARSRALADLLAEARARTTDPGLAAVRDEEAAFGRRFSALQSRIGLAADPGARAAALAELQDLEREYETLVVRIRRNNPVYAALAHPRALRASELAGMLAPDEALLEFLLTEKEGFAWIVRRDTILGYRIPGKKALDPQIRLLPALLAARDEPAIRQLGARLHAALLAPGESALRGTRRLTVVPDGVLQRLPFALLRSAQGWLVETHTLTLAPSATILHYLRESRPLRAPDPFLAFAVPDTHPGQIAIFDGDGRPPGVLRHAIAEVGQARRLLGAAPESTRVGPDATEQSLKSSHADRYRILHFAAHAVADEIVPRRSAVLLTPGGQEDGLLQVSEIANLSLNADLVVLASCRSHVGRLVRGEGLLSLSRAFLHAGARAVVATQWAVPDRETASLMRRFYASLSDGSPPDEALRRAQLAALRSGGPDASPGTWAAFVAVGETRSPVVAASDGRRVRALVVPAGIAVVLLGLAAAVMRRRARERHARLLQPEPGGR